MSATAIIFVGHNKEANNIERSNMVYYWTIKLIHWGIRLLDLDVFSLYKNPRFKKKFTRGQLERLINSLDPIEAKYFHKNKPILLGLIKSFCVYVTIKCIIVGIIQYFLLQYQFLVPKGNRAPPIRLETLQLASQLLGNPLTSLADTSLYIYLGSSGLVLFTFVFLPLILRRNSVDWHYVRLLFCPQLELNRIDSVIERTINHLNQSFENQLYNGAIFEPNHWPAPTTSYELLPNVVARSQPGTRTGDIASSAGKFKANSPRCRTRVREQIKCSQMNRLLVSCRQRIAEFRPAIWSDEHNIAKTVRITCNFFIAPLLCVIIWGIIIWPFLIIFPALNNCKLKQINDCSFNLAYSFPEKIFLAELTLMMGLTAHASVYHIFQMLTMLTSQLKMIQSTSDNLKHHLWLLEELIGLLDNGHKPDAEAIEICNRLEQRLTLDTTLRCTVFEGELGDGFQWLSVLTGEYAYHFCAVLMIVFLTSGMQTQGTYFVRLAFLLGTWLVANAFAIMSSHLNARALELNNIRWSILSAMCKLRLIKRCSQPGNFNDQYESVRLSFGAKQVETNVSFNNGTQKLLTKSTERKSLNMIERLTRRSQPNVTPLAGVDSPPELDRITTLWLRFVYESNLNNTHHCVKPLGFQLTYGRVIELNFFVLFIYSLSVTSLKS